MRDEDFVSFLRWALPRMGYRWPGFRKVRGQVRKRVARRLAEVGLADLEAYRAHLEADPDEWQVLDGLCRITISRFFRDRALFAALGEEILPLLGGRARGASYPALRMWSVGCGAGEEPYSLAILLHEEPRLRSLEVPPEIVCTDTDEHQLERARRACYPPGSLRELPPEWRQRAFRATPAGELCLRRRFRRGVRLLEQDVRRKTPEGSFALILCRNLVFTYFDERTQRRVLRRLGARLQPGGALVVGSHEALPADAHAFEAWPGQPLIHRLAHR